MKTISHILHILCISLLICLPASVQAQVFAQFSTCSFNTPLNGAFTETYLYVDGPALFAKEAEGGFRNSINVAVKILQDSSIIKANKYNLQGPVFQRGNTAPGFLDQQRYSLAPGDYVIEIDITDNYTLRKRTLTIKDSLHVNFREATVNFSGIQPIESYSKAVQTSLLSKSGLDLIPLVGNFYPEKSNQLNFYTEVYNAEKILGKDKPFVLVYYIETAVDHIKLNAFGAFKKQTAALVNPLLGKIDITTLGSGNYILIVEARDGENKLLSSQKMAFVRQNRMMEITTLQKVSELESIARYFGRVQDPDTLKMFVECLWPIANGLDKERVINQSIKKDPELMKKFAVDFWERRAADTADPVKLWAAYYQAVQQTMVLFKCGKQKGYYTDRGRVYLQYGAPSVRSVQQAEENTFPYEVWLYYRTSDQTNGMFFSNRRFVFVNKMLGDDCFKLIQSDMRGEVNNPRWQFEVTRRNNNGLGNLDNNTPAGTEFSHMTEIYNSPR